MEGSDINSIKDECSNIIAVVAINFNDKLVYTSFRV